MVSATRGSDRDSGAVVDGCEDSADMSGCRFTLVLLQVISIGIDPMADVMRED
jgi:hypothetical protein